MSYEHHGVYGSNTWQWNTDDFWKIDAAKFKWALVRTDTTPEVCQWLQWRGIKIIVQAPDTFNKGMPDPGEHAKEIWRQAQLRAPYSNLIVLDNEPNLSKDRASRWWAEQGTRWYRAVMAHFRYLDSYSGHWKIIHPAYVSHAEHNFEEWLRVSRENMNESDAISGHCYWQEEDLIAHPEYGGSWKVYREHYPNKPLYITEYCADILGMCASGRTEQIIKFLQHTEGKALSACYFILGGTKMWEKFHLPKVTAQELGNIIE